MKIKLSKAQWEYIGKTAGWTPGKEYIDDPSEGFTENAPDPKNQNSKPKGCPVCGGNIVRWKAKWAGDKSQMGQGGWQCGQCGHYITPEMYQKALQEGFFNN